VYAIEATISFFFWHTWISCAVKGDRYWHARSQKSL